ncbi:MAG: succinylglutamate desuccinylase/aspartoacylase family protein [Thermoplasmata archaeon]|nr:succinylglutamate desuccinylase/aspartoacylase family protein [Thermoplasmata archaeon]
MKKLAVVFALLLFFPAISAMPMYDKPSTYSQLLSWYEEMEKKYPQYIEIFKANEMYGTGRIDGGYDDYYVRITNESNGFLKPEVLFLGSPHGDETAGTIGMYYFVKWMIENRNNRQIDYLLNHREIYLEISHNPYGFDHRQRYDANGWDLNREADYDWRGYNSELWGSVNGKTLVEFINHHAIRVGADFHGGARMILYPWSSTHKNVVATSPSGKEYAYAPPDFNFFHIASLRLGEYMGSYGGKLDESNIGTIPETVGYEAPGCMAAWAYGSNLMMSPMESKFVKEVMGHYNTGIFWVSPEISLRKNPPAWEIGDESRGYAAEIVRFILHQTDIAQPYVLWSIENNSFMPYPVTLKWQVYGAMVVDETYVKYGYSMDMSKWKEGMIHKDFEGKYRGGTYWDNWVWEEKIDVPENATDIYAIAYAKVDSIYAKVIVPSEYGSSSYLRLIRERTDESYHEVINTSDGVERIDGRIWWQSPLIHIHVGGIESPQDGWLYVMGHRIMYAGKTIIIGRMNAEVSGNFERVEFFIDDDMRYNDSSPPFGWTIQNVFGRHDLMAKMYYSGKEYSSKINAIFMVP